MKEDWGLAWEVACICAACPSPLLTHHQIAGAASMNAHEQVPSKLSHQYHGNCTLHRCTRQMEKQQYIYWITARQAGPHLAALVAGGVGGAILSCVPACLVLELEVTKRVCGIRRSCQEQGGGRCSAGGRAEGACCGSSSSSCKSSRRSRSSGEDNSAATAAAHAPPGCPQGCPS